MAKFTFNLAAVLKQREHVEHECQRDLATAQAELTVLEAELRALDQTAQAATTDLRENRLVGSIDLSFLAAHRRFVLAVQRKALAIVQKIAHAQRKVEEKRMALADAARARKALEKLRDKRFELWRAEQSKKEMDALDEASTQLSHHELSQADTASATMDEVTS